MPRGVVSHYQVLDPVGRGGMGVVHKGRDLRLGRFVALKFLSPDRLASAEDRERFLREARALSALNHPHIATVYEVDENDGEPFMAMEFLPGGTLRDRLLAARAEGRDLPVPALMTWGIGLAEALEHAHAHGIIHRDVKSSNAMFDEQGRIKLTDFGLAKARGSSDLTGSGVVAGTVGYMAPEQLLGSGADPRTDLYALGVVLYEAATCTLPFRADSPAAAIEKILHAPPEPPGRTRADLPEGFDRIVTRLIAKSPDERYPDATQLLRDLRTVGSGVVAFDDRPTVTLGAPSDARSSDRPGLMALGGLTLAALLAAGAYWLVRPPSLPDRKQIAVLPVRCIGGDADQQIFCDGLTETLTSALSQVGSLAVVPASEMRNVKSVEQARNLHGVNLAVYASLQRQADQVKLAISLVDAETKHALDSETIRGSMSDLYELEDGLLAKLADLMDTAIPIAEAEMLATSSSAVPDAFEAYLRGRGLLLRFDKPGNLDRALAKFEEAAVLDPLLSLAHAGVAEVRLRMYRARRQSKDLEAARASAEHALALSPELASAQLVLGAVLIESGSTEEGLHRLEAAFRADPRNAAVYREIASLFRWQKRFKEAEAIYRRAILARPGDWMSHAELAKFLYGQLRFAEAAEEYRKVIELAPDSHIGYRNLGGVLLAMEYYPEAERMMREGEALHPSSRGLSNLGTLYMFQERYREAVPVLEEAARLAATDAPEEFRIWGNLGDAHWLAGDDLQLAGPGWRRAGEIAEVQLSGRPGDADLESVLAEYYAKLRQREKAFERLTAALDHAPQSALVHYQAGVVHAIFEDYGRAIEQLRQALDLGDVAGQIRQAPELRGLRASPGFQELDLLPEPGPKPTS